MPAYDDDAPAAAGTMPEKVSGLLIEAAEDIRHLRDLLSFAAGIELEDAKPQGQA